MRDTIKIAKYLFTIDAVLGILAIGGAALYAAAYSSKGAVLTFILVFVPCSALWASFCYGAFKGLTSKSAILNLLFWLFVVGHFFAFPVGTAISALCIWLRREVSPPPKPDAKET